MRQTAICASHHQSGFRDFVAHTSLVVVVVLLLFGGWVGIVFFSCSSSSSSSMLAAAATTQLAISSLLDGEQSGSNGRRSRVDAVYVHSCDLCRVSHTGRRSRKCVSCLAHSGHLKNQNYDFVLFCKSAIQSGKIKGLKLKLHLAVEDDEMLVQLHITHVQFHKV